MSCRSAASSGFCTKHEPELWCSQLGECESVRVWPMTLLLLLLRLLNSLPVDASCSAPPVLAGSRVSGITRRRPSRRRTACQRFVDSLHSISLSLSLSDSLGFGFWCSFANSFPKKMLHVSKFSSRVYQHTDSPGRVASWRSFLMPSAESCCEILNWIFAGSRKSFAHYCKFPTRYVHFLSLCDEDIVSIGLSTVLPLSVR